MAIWFPPAPALRNVSSVYSMCACPGGPWPSCARTAALFNILLVFHRVAPFGRVACWEGPEVLLLAGSQDSLTAQPPLGESRSPGARSGSAWSGQGHERVWLFSAEDRGHQRAGPGRRPVGGLGSWGFLSAGSGAGCPWGVKGTAAASL